MGYEHFFNGPDGTELAVITKAELDRLRAADRSGGGAEIAAARAALDEGKRRGFMPDAVLSEILEGTHPIAAWRHHRGMSQAALARETKLSQVWLSRIERGGGHGTTETRRKIAAALDAPLWTLDQDD